MSVVLRCPTCGTTQGHAGECDACSEGEVLYFCTNHDEGVWLDGPMCSRCGARFGDPPKRPAPSRPARPTRPAGAPDFRPPERRRVPERPRDLDVGHASPRRRELDDPAEPEVAPRTPLGELLGDIIEEHARARRTYDAGVPPPAPPSLARVGFPLAGCLVRIVGLVFVLIAVAIILMFLLFGGFIVG